MMYLLFDVLPLSVSMHQYTLSFSGFLSFQPYLRMLDLVGKFMLDWSMPSFARDPSGENSALAINTEKPGGYQMRTTYIVPVQKLTHFVKRPD